MNFGTISGVEREKEACRSGHSDVINGGSIVIVPADSVPAQFRCEWTEPCHSNKSNEAKNSYGEKYKINKNKSKIPNLNRLRYCASINNCIPDIELRSIVHDKRCPFFMCFCCVCVRSQSLFSTKCPRMVVARDQRSLCQCEGMWMDDSESKTTVQHWTKSKSVATFSGSQNRKFY